MHRKVVGQRYQLVRLIGAGGMGSVYEAVDSVTGARVAVKLITAETAQNPTLMGRFEREARAAATIDTPHIVKVLDAGTAPRTLPAGGTEGGQPHPDDVPFLVLEYLEGEDVQQLIKRLGPLPPDLALRIVAQACLGLDRAHQARIVHRDIKPANFFLAKVGAESRHPQRVVKLLDFGIAKITHDPELARGDTAALTSTGSMLGSPLYMSPEQARGHKDIDHRADIWSLGVVLYQALTGRTPHQDTDALGELIIAICTEEPPTVQEAAPWVSPAIAAIAHHAMRFSPEERYQTAADMLDEIRPLLPDGWAIEESMFRLLTDAERAHVAPRFSVRPDHPAGRSGRPDGLSGSGETPPRSRPDAVASDLTPSGSLQGFGTTQAPPRPAGATRGVLVALAATLGLVAGGAAAYRVMQSGVKVSGAEAAPSAAALPHAVTVLPEIKPRTVRLVILPADATVEIDGIAATTEDGTVEVTGTLASVHKVRIRSGDNEVVRDVVVAEGGAIPAKVELPALTGAIKPAGGNRPSVPRPPSGAGTVPLPLRPQR